MNMMMKHTLAVSLLLVSIGGFTACSQTTERTTAERTVVEDEQMATDDAAGGDTVERPVGHRTGTEDNVGTTTDRQMQETGTTGSAAQRDNVVGERRPMGGAEHTAADQRVTQQIQRMQPGKRPLEYAQNIQQMGGTVTEYRLNDNRNQATMRFMMNNREYELTMDVNPQRYTVNRIEMNQ